jgi:predicted nuclease of predicted toxin-antitoxin system
MNLRNTARCGFHILGISDPEVLKFAQAEDRILLTFDKDFEELAFV